MAAHPSGPVNRLAIWALILSILGVTAPIGLYLSYRSLSTIRKTRESGEAFAIAAKWIGWLWVIFWVIAFAGYFWITSQGN